MTLTPDDFQPTPEDYPRGQRSMAFTVSESILVTDNVTKVTAFAHTNHGDESLIFFKDHRYAPKPGQTLHVNLVWNGD